jgi:hypothetical protein
MATAAARFEGGSGASGAAGIVLPLQPSPSAIRSIRLRCVYPIRFLICFNLSLLMRLHFCCVVNFSAGMGSFLNFIYALVVIAVF